MSFRTSWDKVCQSVEYVVKWGLEHRQLGQIAAIGVDEIQYAKGHKVNAQKPLAIRLRRGRLGGG